MVRGAIAGPSDGARDRPRRFPHPGLGHEWRTALKSTAFGVVLRRFFICFHMFHLVFAGESAVPWPFGRELSTDAEGSAMWRRSCPGAGPPRDALKDISTYCRHIQMAHKKL